MLPVHTTPARARSATASPRETALAFELQRRVDLVWRGGENVPAPPASDRRVVVPGVIDASGERTAVAAVSPTPAMAAVAAQAATPARVTLDPSVTDRLVDDVIRRVERQVRLDRERRGL